MADLKTNYVDDVLDTSVNVKRKYRMIQNAGGTVSFDDVTTYTQNGDSFGAKDINDTNAAVNELNSNLSTKLLYAFQPSDIANSDYVETVSGGFYKTGHIITIIATIKTKETTITGPVWFVNTVKNFVPPKPLGWTNNDINGAYLENTSAALFQFQYHYFPSSNESYYGLVSINPSKTSNATFYINHSYLAEY